jgi:hypothetical protein
LGNRQLWGPQWPEKRFSHHPADHGKRHQDETKTAIEHNAILTGHAPSQSFGWNRADGSSLPIVATILLRFDRDGARVAPRAAIPFSVCHSSLELGSRTLDQPEPSRLRASSRKACNGSRTEIPGSFGTSGYVRIAALRLKSQVCHERSLPSEALAQVGVPRHQRCGTVHLRRSIREILWTGATSGERLSVPDLMQDGFAADPATGDQLRFAAVHRPEQSILPATAQ